MSHDPQAAEVIEDEFFHCLPDTGLESTLVILDALTAADLSIVPEGYGRIGGQVVKLEQIADLAYDPVNRDTRPWSSAGVDDHEVYIVHGGIES